MVSATMDVTIISPLTLPKGRSQVGAILKLLAMAEGCFLVSARTANLVDPGFVRIVIIITLMFMEYLACMYPAVRFVAVGQPLSQSDSSVTPCPCAVALQALPSMGLSRQGYWSGLPCPPPGDLPDPEMEGRCVSCIGRWILYRLSHLGKPPSTPTKTFEGTV